MNDTIGWLAADWPAPAHIQAGITLRSGGVSDAPFDSFNLGDHVGDDSAAVAENRRRLVDGLSLPAEPAWLHQVHGSAVASADGAVSGDADASVGTTQEAVCAVLTADCLPVLLCDLEGTCWAAAHAGWRSLAAGVLEATVEAMPARPADIMAWLGPAIGPCHFEVGAEVRAAFVDANADDFSSFTEGARPGKFMVDLHALARARLSRSGVKNVHGAGLCTVDDKARLYSYRRDSRTGRMAALVWSTR